MVWSASLTVIFCRINTNSCLKRYWSTLEGLIPVFLFLNWPIRLKREASKIRKPKRTYTKWNLRLDIILSKPHSDAFFFLMQNTYLLIGSNLNSISHHDFFFKTKDLGMNFWISFRYCPKANTNRFYLLAAAFYEKEMDIHSRSAATAAAIASAEKMSSRIFFLLTYCLSSGQVCACSRESLLLSFWTGCYLLMHTTLVCSTYVEANFSRMIDMEGLILCKDAYLLESNQCKTVDVQLLAPTDSHP